MHQGNIYYIMIGAPSDISDEIEIIKKRIAEWNDCHSHRFQIVLLPLHWRSNTYAATGESPQSLINKQMLDKSDAMIAVFASRLGTPTDRYESGTVEEIYTHIESKKNVLIFFKENIPTARCLEDIDQQKDLLLFKEKISKKSLPITYRDESEFSDLVFSHIIKMVNSNFASYKEEVTREGKIENEINLPISTEHKRFFAKLVLIGAIKENIDSDWELLEKYFDSSKKEILNTIREFYHNKQIVITIENRIWEIKEKGTYWEKFASYFYDVDLELFQELAITVLNNCSDNKNNPTDAYSYLSQGVAEGVAIIANSGHLCVSATRILIANAPSIIHRAIFTENTTETWCKLSSYLPSLAESAPSLYMISLNELLLSIDTPPSTIKSYGFYSSLLASLETLAWYPDHFSLSCELLAKLPLYINEDSQYHSSREVLTEILLPWLPQTLASSKVRQAVITNIRAVNAPLAQNLLINLLPYKNDHSRYTRQPIWALSNELSSERKVTNKEFSENSLFYANTLINNCSNSQEFIGLISELRYLPSESLTKLSEKLESVSKTQFTQEERATLAEFLETELRDHRCFPDANWAFNVEEMQLLEKLCDKIKPDDLFLQLSHILKIYPYQYHNVDNNYDACKAMAQEEKKQVIRRLIVRYNKKDTIELISTLTETQLAAFALADMNDQDLDEIILPDYLGVSGKNALATFYVACRFRDFGEIWFKQVFKSDWTNQQKGQFLTALPFEESTWHLVDENLGSADSEYWMHVWPYRERMVNFNDYPVKKFLQYTKYKEALECLFRMQELCAKNSISVDLEVVIKLLLEIGDYSGTLDFYRIAKLIQWVQNNWTGSKERIIELEFEFINAESYSQSFIPICIYSKLSTDAKYFHYMLSLAYKGNAENTSYSDDRKKLARKAHNILRKWNIVPGVQEGDFFDSDLFESWINTVKKLCETSGHIRVALSTIGSLLIHAPAGSDLWIHKAIAKELNREENSSMRHAYSSGLYNARGAHFVDPSGSQERALAKKYNDRAIALDEHGFSRLASTMRAIANTYNREALER